MNYSETESFCSTCGELLNLDCVCHLDETDDMDGKDIKFEYAFESITEANSPFKRKYADN